MDRAPSRLRQRLVLAAILLVAFSCDDTETQLPTSDAGKGGSAGVAGVAGDGARGGEAGAAGGDQELAGQGGAGQGGAGDSGQSQGGALEVGGAFEWGGDTDVGQGGSIEFPAPPSCEGLKKTCGPNGDQDCCASTLVPALGLGEFARSNDPQFPATLDDFRLDKFEITVGRFRRFAAAYADGYRPAEGEGKSELNAEDPGWDPAWDSTLPKDDMTSDIYGVTCDDVFQTWTSDEGDSESESRPLNCLTWHLANAFCIWDGGRLPTEAEWNFAAAGGGDAFGWRQYPWSEPSSSLAIDDDHASYYSTDCWADGEATCTVNDIVVVGSKAAGTGRFGQVDLAGNLAEWMQDLYDAYPMPCNNCANLTVGSDRVFRGGGYDNDESYLLSSTRRTRNPKHRSADVGARCARSAR